MNSMAIGSSGNMVEHPEYIDTLVTVQQLYQHVVNDKFCTILLHVRKIETL